MLGVKSSSSAALLLTLLVTLSTTPARSQCMLANPSFEILGGGAFGGWNHFGAIGPSTVATHGARGARVSGPNSGSWDVSGFWQRLDSAPGDRWTASVCASHASTKPVTGESTAILNIEWRDSNGDLIDFESHTVIDASTPTDEIIAFEVESQPAPSGTVATHLLLGVLQSPSDPSPDVFYDEARFENDGPPTPEDLQWLDFPGGRSVDFGGHSWRVKGPGWYGPGPNNFCHTEDCVWVDAEDRLHITIQFLSSAWRSTEVTLEDVLGYGDYIFTTRGPIDQLHQNVVLGMFLWEYGPCFAPENGWWNPYNEIDVEFSRWGNPSNDAAQFVAQPWDTPGNVNRFDATYDEDELASHAFRWLPDRLEFRSWRGGPADESPETMVHEWTYTGVHIPRPDRPRVHLNLWLFDGSPNVAQEVVFEDFTFDPACFGPHCDESGTGIEDAAPLTSRVTHLTHATPNPFNPQTTIGYSVVADGPVEIVLYDIVGRQIRTLVDRFTAAGDYSVQWDGLDEDSNRVSSGVYLIQLRAGNVRETRRVVLLK